MADDSDSESLRLHVSIGDVTVDVEGPVDEAETWFEGLREDYLSDVDTEAVQAAADGAGSVSQDTGGKSKNETGGSTASRTKTRSLTEFYKESDNPTKQERALIVGWYLEYHEDLDDFTSTEVEERAQDAKIGLGANVSRDLSNQAGNGRLEKVDEREGKDAYHLTLTGEEYVQEELLEL
ncbi:hypothetical protein Hbl1158_03305 [Halobaculum sp. CBA1158]|uniref:hypothetical protein n=1 Tax=Halobaculum sp. CBA1158 TaxID=2904243 RepID=UPI001F2A1B0F|nr:hypothetical protein [Halobaculum sp. CBA1158]UIP00405.1 hypothetical protein Hbl1158_03305 [Halobaculum sp. CBA1158]